MGDGFRKFKKKSFYTALIEGAVCGISFGLFVLGALILALKLAGIPLHAGYYALISISAAIGCGVLAFFICYPSDQKLAAELDKKYGLNERVQTSLAYQNETGAVVEMLHEDTDARLKSIPKFKFTLKNFWLALKQNISRIWVFIVIVPVAVALVVSAMLAPSKIVEGDGGEKPKPDNPFVLDELHIEGLNRLIEEIGMSELDEELKNSATESIGQLKSDLEEIQWESEMSDIVTSAMYDVNALLSGSTSYKAIANSLGRTGLSEFATIVSDGGQVYRDYRLVEYSEVENFLAVSVEETQNKLNESVTLVFDTLLNGADTAAAQILLAVAGANIGEDDPLYQIFIELAQGLKRWQEGGESSPQMKFYYDICDELAAQSYVQAMSKYICNALAEIFEVPVISDPVFVPSESSSSGDDENDKSSSGGFGGGELKGGSDDMIYNPNTGEYEKYIDILGEYYAIVDAMLRDGTLTEEQINVIKAYFDILYGGISAGE